MQKERRKEASRFSGISLGTNLVIKIHHRLQNRSLEIQPHNFDNYAIRLLDKNVKTFNSLKQYAYPI